MTTIQSDWSPEERAALIAKMTHAKDVFYGLDVAAGHHQFLEFAGFLHEYIKLCTEAHEAGTDFSTLPMQEHHAAYIAEKIECIYGPSLKRSPELTKAFLEKLFGTVRPVPETDRDELRAKLCEAQAELTAHRMADERLHLSLSPKVRDW